MTDTIPTGAPDRTTGPNTQPLSTTLPSRPADKKPRLPPNGRIVKRSLNTGTTRPHPRLTRAEPHLAPKRRIVLHPGTDLVAVLKRVQKLLDRSPGGALSLGLGGKKPKAGRRPQPQPDEDEVLVGDERFPVMVVGAGPRNIEKALRTAAVFQRRGDCVVRMYTNTVGGVDTYEVDEEGEDGEGDADMSGTGDGEPHADGRTTGTTGRTVTKHRSRKASSLEVAIRLR